MQTIRIAPWVSWVPDAASLILFDSRDGSYHALNPSASDIWRGLAAGQDQACLAADLADAANVAASEVAHAISEFVTGALEKGLLVAD